MIARVNGGRTGARRGVIATTLLLAAACADEAPPMPAVVEAPAATAIVAPPADAAWTSADAAAPTAIAATAEMDAGDDGAADEAQGGGGTIIGIGNIGTIGRGRRAGMPATADGGTLATGRIVVTSSGPLSNDAIARALRTNLGRARRCYEHGLAQRPDLTGTVKLLLSVGSNGLVTAAQDDGSNLPDARVVGCIRRGFLNVVFAPASGPTTIHYATTLVPS